MGCVRESVVTGRTQGRTGRRYIRGDIGALSWVGCETHARRFHERPVQVGGICVSREARSSRSDAYMGGVRDALYTALYGRHRRVTGALYGELHVGP